MLIVFSLSISALVTILAHVFGKRRKHRDLLPLKKEETYYEKEVDVCRINRTGFRASDMGNVVEAEELMADKVNLYMKAAMEEYQIPGLSVAIVQDGDIVFTNSYGVTAEGSTVSSKTPFYWIPPNP